MSGILLPEITSAKCLVQLVEAQIQSPWSMLHLPAGGMVVGSINLDNLLKSYCTLT